MRIYRYTLITLFCFVAINGSEKRGIYSVSSLSSKAQEVICLKSSKKRVKILKDNEIKVDTRRKELYLNGPKTLLGAVVSRKKEGDYITTYDFDTGRCRSINDTTIYYTQARGLIRTSEHDQCVHFTWSKTGKEEYACQLARKNKKYLMIHTSEYNISRLRLEENCIIDGILWSNDDRYVCAYGRVNETDYYHIIVDACSHKIITTEIIPAAYGIIPKFYAGSEKILYITADPTDSRAKILAYAYDDVSKKCTGRRIRKLSHCERMIFSPDATKIVHYDLFNLNKKTEQYICISNTLDKSTVKIKVPGNTVGAAVCFSKDNKKIAIGLKLIRWTDEYEIPYRSSELWIIDPEASEKIEKKYDLGRMVISSLDWSPTGRYFALHHKDSESIFDCKRAEIIKTSPYGNYEFLDWDKDDSQFIALFRDAQANASSIRTFKIKKPSLIDRFLSNR